MSRLLLVLALAATTALPALAQAQAPRGLMAAPAQPVLDTATGSRFACEGGGEIKAHFVAQDAKLVAIVDAGDGPHVLPLRPFAGGPAVITWSDGTRTLTWSPSVQIHFMDGRVHKNCGRGGGHKH